MCVREVRAQVTDQDGRSLSVEVAEFETVEEIAVKIERLIDEVLDGGETGQTGEFYPPSFVLPDSLDDLRGPVTGIVELPNRLLWNPGLPAPVSTPHLSREESISHYAPGTDLAGLDLATLVDLGAEVFHLTDVAPGGTGPREIPATAFADRDRDRDLGGAAVLLHTGWSRHFGARRPAGAGRQVHRRSARGGGLRHLPGARLRDGLSRPGGHVTRVVLLSHPCIMVCSHSTSQSASPSP